MASTPSHDGIALVGFDADDTLWRSQEYFDAAQAQFEQILSAYVDLDDVLQRLYDYEARNIAIFGYGVKGMALSMVEAAVEITQGRISATDIHRIVALAKTLLQHPVALLDGVHAAVTAVAARYPVVLITKGDLFHQEAKVRQSGLADLFRRIEVVSEKDPPTYARLLEEFGIPAHRFLMVGNSLRSDIAPVLALGGYGVHVPYHTTWQHEAGARIDAGRERMRTVASLMELPDAIASLDAQARATPLSTQETAA
ncbi:MAG: HAD family hydrolase [Thermomonas hydrothermalis]|uniref:HAD family hydrolase n=1 Tax=Thermomonas hydrothermalis TaxID=213588 RepID=UPI0023535BF3|nr:HAD family hydrolase [Thermomonas hydrothermalis]MCL6619309.1 HAD family hydrolase [Thermomonas hydrothermalis]